MFDKLSVETELAELNGEKEASQGQTDLVIVTALEFRVAVDNEDGQLLQRPDRPFRQIFVIDLRTNTS